MLTLPHEVIVADVVYLAFFLLTVGLSV